MRTPQELEIEKLIARLENQHPSSEQLSEIKAILDNKNINKKEKLLSKSPVPRLSFSSQANSSATDSGSNTPKSPQHSMPNSRESSPRKRDSLISRKKILGRNVLFNSDPAAEIISEGIVYKKKLENFLLKLDKKSDDERFYISQDEKKYEFVYLKPDIGFPQKRVFQIDRQKKFGEVEYKSCVYIVTNYKNKDIPDILSGKSYQISKMNKMQERRDLDLRFNEIKILKLLDRYYGHIELVNESEGNKKIANEFIIFQTCKEGIDWSKSPPPSPFQLVKIMLGAMDQLFRIHSAGIIHRDLKPGNFIIRPDYSGNFIIGPDYSVFLIDFDTALVLADAPKKALQEFIGTFGYHWKGLLPVEPKERKCYNFDADWWVLSVIFAEKTSRYKYLEQILTIKIASFIPPETIQAAVADVLNPDEVLNNAKTKFKKEKLDHFFKNGAAKTENLLYEYLIFPELKKIINALFFKDQGLIYAKEAYKKMLIILKSCIDIMESDKKIREIREKAKIEEEIISNSMHSLQKICPDSLHYFFDNTSEKKGHTEKNTQAAIKMGLDDTMRRPS